MPEAAGDTDERLLHDVLGQPAVPRQEVGEPQRPWRVAHIEVLEPAGGDRSLRELRLGRV